MVHTNVNVCDVLSRGSTDVVCSAGQKNKKKTYMVLVFSLTHAHTDAAVSSFPSSFFVSVSVLRHASSFPNPQAHLIEEVCVCGCVERVLQCFHLRVTQNPSPVLYHLHLHSVCVFVCTLLMVTLS